MTDTLSHCLANPGHVSSLTDVEIERVLIETTVLQGRLSSLAEAVLLRVLSRKHDSEARDRLLDVDEAAAFLGVDGRWIRRRARVLPFVRRLSGKAIRISEEGMRRWVAASKAA
jgi:hypothetical protein